MNKYKKSPPIRRRSEKCDDFREPSESSWDSDLRDLIQIRKRKRSPSEVEERRNNFNNNNNNDYSSPPSSLRSRNRRQHLRENSPAYCGDRRNRRRSQNDSAIGLNINKKRRFNDERISNSRYRNNNARFRNDRFKYRSNSSNRDNMEIRNNRVRDRSNSPNRADKFTDRDNNNVYQAKSENYHQRRKSSKFNIRDLGFRRLQNLVENDDIDQVLLELCNDRIGFWELLDNNRNISDDTIVLIVRLMGNICKSAFPNNKITILTRLLQSLFLDKLTLYVTSLVGQSEADVARNRVMWDNPDLFWNSIIIWSKTVQQLIPNRFDSLQKLLIMINLIIKSIEQTRKIKFADSIYREIEILSKPIEEAVKITDIIAESKDTTQEPPNDFREIQIIPTAQELTTDNETTVFLRPNITKGPFNDVDHYLDIQFRLLREDFVAPLRRGISTYVQNQTKSRNERLKLDDIKVYDSVKFLSFETVNEHTCYKLRFCKNKSKISYQNSKRFMHGSLLCFTNDNFSTIFFGKIVQRNLDLLKQGMIVVEFQEDKNVDLDKDYVMVESSVYFEPYYQVLSVLQQMDASIFPMPKYIIDVERATNAPEYLRKPESVMYTIQGEIFPALEIPSQSFYNFNYSQLKAFRSAIMNEFSIIQGPPGTGKTYLGLKIAETLIKNEFAWHTNKTPMLIICYTNHALDQFLEGLIPVVDGKEMLRVGGQSKNEALKKYNLIVKRRSKRFTHTGAAVHQKSANLKSRVEQLRILDDELNRIEKNSEIIDFKKFQFLECFTGSWFNYATNDDILKWLFEGKYRKRSLVQPQRTQQDDEDIKISDNNNHQFDNDELNDKFVMNIDDNFNENEHDEYFNGFTEPILSIRILKDRLKRTQVTLLEILKYQKRKFDDNNLISIEQLEHEKLEIQNDLDYLDYQLNLYQRPDMRMKPYHVDLKNPHKMRYQDRWQLYFYWVDQYVRKAKCDYEKANKKFRQIHKEYNELREIDDTLLMKEHLVVGMTTTCAARLQTSLLALKPRIVIVEEAAEILESHIVAALTNSCEHLILIGDHLQLKPSTADYKIETEFKLGISLFERMVKNNIKCHTLNIQHRMRPEISRLIKPHIYPNLMDDESTLHRKRVLGVASSLFFIDHNEPESASQDVSKKNMHESQFLIALARHLILNGCDPKRITILAAYLGQFFEIRNEKANSRYESLLKDVRISVLDNYQGEESDIILLSLVRSNKENKLGFLRIQNRVCVALSRARNGLFIMGNMSLLLNAKSENNIWEKVKKVLDEQNAIGQYLPIQCQIHKDRITKVSKAEDFNEIHDGGCDLPCNAKLKCGHRCQKLCHIEDKRHSEYRCREKCTRLLCANSSHICRRECYQHCGLCYYTVPKILERCGHSVEIYCHLKLDEYKCEKTVDATLPCGHTVSKPCSADPQTFKCPSPCEFRVEPCGHQCRRSCHTQVDPDHLQFKCREPCGKPMLGCQNAEDPHICPGKCYQTCTVCDVSVEKVLSCGHQYEIACNVNLEDIICTKPCQNTLSCGHPCGSKCFEPCKPCEVLVKKTIPECEHSVEMPCSIEPTKAFCTSTKCPKTLICGHACTKSCKNPCSTECNEIVNCEIEAPCGHTVRKLPCKLKDSSSNNRSLLKFCNSPCETQLKCGHTCKGNCGACRQSRFHQKCAEKCGVPLVCNHLCPIQCREACKPCTLPCQIRCKHSKCSKKCGEPCTPCKQPCDRRCAHVKCTKLCSEHCNVEPCIKRCRRHLKCGHKCVGFCGDSCPILCGKCNKEELTEIFFGKEADSGAIFVQLNDCGHVFEHSGLEQWLKQDENRIQFKKCPKCTTNITTTKRYSNYINLAIDDVTSVKREIFGTTKENNHLREELQKECKTLCDKFKYLPFVVSLYGKISRRLAATKNNRNQTINKIELNAIKVKLQFYNYMCDIFKENNNPSVNFFKHEMIKKQLTLIVSVLNRSIAQCSQQENEDVQCEIKRLRRMVEYMNIKNDNGHLDKTVKEDEKKLIEDIEAILLLPKRYTDTVDEEMRNYLKTFAEKVKSRVMITEQERIEIVQAIGLSKGHWFKCPNGHPYAIGECGGAMQITKCFCGAPIGGTNHHLLGNNALASEMDGATRHAWPGSLH